MISWRSPNRIKYSIEDIVFILSHFSEIELGEWPPECRDTGYANAPISKRRLYKASRENCISIVAIVDIKLKPTGFDGELAKELYDGTYCDDGFLWARKEELMKKYGLSQDGLEDRTDCAIAFASSQTQTYDGFKSRFYKRRYKG